MPFMEQAGNTVAEFASARIIVQQLPLMVRSATLMCMLPVDVNQLLAQRLNHFNAAGEPLMKGGIPFTHQHPPQNALPTGIQRLLCQPLVRFFGIIELEYSGDLRPDHNRHGSCRCPPDRPVPA